MADPAAARYATIIADPPWSYRNAGCRGAAANQYPTMTLKDICALPVANLAAPDSVLLLWATWPQPERDFVGLLSPNLRHSRKPASIYEYAEALPGPRVELFARRSRDGWDVWGNEVASVPLFDGIEGARDTK